MFNTFSLLFLFFFVEGIQTRQIFTSVIENSPTPIQRDESFVPGLSVAGSDEFRTSDEWRKNAIQKLWNERKLMTRTPLVHLNIPTMPNVDFIFKNESASRTGSLKHRYAWALVFWALLEGHITQNTTVFEASSGNTATSEGYMLNLLGVNFVVVVPDTLEKIKEDRIREYTSEIIKTYIGKRIERAEEESRKRNGFFMNQFANADRAEEFHESGNFKFESVNIMHEIVSQLTNDYRNPENNIPNFFVAAGGTGGTISSVGKYVKKYNLPTQVVLADTEFSIYYDLVLHGRFRNESGAKFWVEPGMAGFGFGTIGPAILGKTSSLLPSVIDRAIKIPDLASTAAMHFLQEIGVHGGTSTGTNFITSLSLAAKESAKNSSKIKIVTLLADNSHYYEQTYLNRTWIEANFQPHGGLPVFDCWKRIINESYYISGNDPILIGIKQCSPNLFKLNNNNNFN